LRARRLGRFAFDAKDHIRVVSAATALIAFHMDGLSPAAKPSVPFPSARINSAG